MIHVRRVSEILGGDGSDRSLRFLSIPALRRGIRTGLSRSAAENVTARLYSDPRERRALLYRIVPEGSWKRRRAGARLSPTESERTTRLASVVALAEDVWGDLDDARSFLTTPHPELGGEKPVEAAIEEFGARQVEQILEGIRHGIPA